jgi:hypothetical protein
LIEICKIPTVETEIFFIILSSLDNSKFLEILTLLPLFNDEKISWVDKRHPYELDEKTAQKGLLDEEEMHGQRCIESASTHNEAKTIF